MRYLIGFLMFGHGLIHLLGFIKAFRISPINQLTREISKPLGIAWLATALLMMAASAVFFLKIRTAGGASLLQGL